MHLIDEEHVVRLQIGEQRGKVAGALDNRSRGLAQTHAKLVGDDMREGCFAETRRTKNQHVVKSFATLAGRVDEDVHLLVDRALPDILA